MKRSYVIVFTMVSLFRCAALWPQEDLEALVKSGLSLGLDVNYVGDRLFRWLNRLP